MIIRGAACGAILTITVLSLVPGELRPDTGLWNKLEHFIAYFITAGLTTVAVNEVLTATLIVGLLSGYAAILETAQLWVPGRHAAFSDWVAGSLGVLMGVASATIVLRLLVRLGGRRSP